MTPEIKEQIMQLVRKYGTGEFVDILMCQVVGWPSGLRRWFKAPVISMAWVRIPPLPLHFFLFPVFFFYFCVLL